MAVAGDAVMRPEAVKGANAPVSGLTLANFANQPIHCAWQEEPDENGRSTKVPYVAPGKRASSTNRATWLGRAQAEALAATLPGKVKGIGIFLGPPLAEHGLWLIGADFDTCRDPIHGTIEPWALTPMRALGTYTETSPSEMGTKAYALIRAQDVDAARAALGLNPGAWGGVLWKGKSGGNHPPAVETYFKARFFAVTGEHEEGFPHHLRVLDVADLAALGTAAKALGAGAGAGAGNGAAAPGATTDAPPGVGNGQDRDESRSGYVWRLALVMQREGKSYEDWCDAAQDLPEAGDWFATKGSRYGEREARRTWERAGEAVAKERAAHPAGSEFEPVDGAQADAPTLDDIPVLLDRYDVAGLRKLRKAHGDFFDHYLEGAWTFNEIDAPPEVVRRLLTLPAFKPKKKPVLRYGEDNRVAPAEDTTVVEGIAHKGSITLPYGPPKSGKTFLMLDLALAIVRAQQADWMGHEIVEHGPILYVACEGYAGFWRRTRAAAGVLADEFVTMEGRLTLIESSDNGRTYAPHPDDIIAAVWDMTRKLGRFPVGAFVDTVFRSFGTGNVNASDHMNAYLAALQTIADLGIAVFPIHHAGKTTGTPIGSTSLMAAADTIILVEKVKEDDDTDNVHRWCIEMAKDDAATGWRGFLLEVVQVGPNARGKQVTSCKVTDLGVLPATKKGRPRGSTMQDYAWSLLRGLVGTEGQDNQPGVPNGVPAVPVDRWRDEVYRRTKPGEPQGTKQRAFHRYRDNLLAEERIGISGDFVWPEFPARGPA
jgi:hypothetical protein